MGQEIKRKSFVFNIEWQEVLMDYPPEVRLEVYDAIIEYVASGTLSELKPLATIMINTMILLQKGVRLGKKVWLIAIKR